MSFVPLLAEGGFNWIGLAITVVVLAVGWLILRAVLKLTMKIFAIGCLSLLIAVGVAFLAIYFSTPH